MEPQDLILHLELRSQLQTPQGELISGTIEETTPELVRRTKEFDGPVIAVGDVVTEILINHGVRPYLIITDGYTKREKLTTWPDYPGYLIIETKCPAAQITKTTWTALKEISSDDRDNNKYHMKVDGEEDLLVLPIIHEFEKGMIIYGQPNVGAVIRVINTEAKEFNLKIMQQMVID